ncbi:hypothetical protein EON65_32825 [archaeon]|nr:MAG: hypothetical protein EON65_32825 [archaeon]
MNTSDQCCSGVCYCADTKCKSVHWEESHWLLCGASNSSYLKELMSYLLALPERLIIEIACELVATVISSSIRESIMVSSDVHAVLGTKLAALTSFSGPSVNLVPTDVHEVVEETFSLLCSLLFNDRLSTICTHYNELLCTHTGCSLAEVSASAVSKSVMKVLNLEMWTRVIAFVDIFSVPVYLPSPTQLMIHNLPSTVHDYKQRLEYLTAFQNELQDAAVYLTGKLLPCPTEFREHPSDLEQLQVERAVYMLAQAASLQLSSPLITLDDNAHGNIGNPFGLYGVTVHVLVPGLFPSSALEQSCCPNLVLHPVYVHKNKRWKISFKAARDILDSEGYSFDFVKSDGSCKSFGMFQHLYAIDQYLDVSTCHCSECKYNQDPFGFLSGYISLPIDDLSQLYYRIDGKKNKLSQLTNRDVAHLLAQALSLNNTFHMLREIILVADSQAAIKRFSKAALLYANVLNCILDAMLNLLIDTHPVDHVDSCASVSEHVSFCKEWISKLCLSLGASCFEHIVSEDGADECTIDMMHTAYTIGNFLDPSHLQLKELIMKMTAYSLSLRNSVGLLPREIPCKQVFDDVFLTTSAEISCDKCDWVIEQAETHAVQSGQSWTTSRHYAVPTTDIPIHHIPAVSEWFTQFMHTTAKSLIQQCYFPRVPWNDLHIVINDSFIVKYEGNSATSGLKQRSLPLHMDQSTHSFTIALNDIDDYVGGGTYLPQMGDAVRPGNNL